MNNKFLYLFYLFVLFSSGCSKTLQKERAIAPNTLCGKNGHLNKVSQEERDILLNTFRGRSGYGNTIKGKFNFNHVKFKKGRSLNDALLGESDYAELERTLYNALHCCLSVKDDELVNKLLINMVQVIDKSQLHMHSSELRVVEVLLKLKAVLFLKMGKTCEDYLNYLVKFKCDYLVMMGVPHVSFFVFEKKSSFSIGGVLEILSALESNSDHFDLTFVLKAVRVKLRVDSECVSELKEMQGKRDVNLDKMIMTKFFNKGSPSYDSFLLDFIFSLMPENYLPPGGEYAIWLTYLEGVPFPMRVNNVFFSEPRPNDD